MYKFELEDQFFINHCKKLQTLLYRLPHTI